MNLHATDYGTLKVGVQEELFAEAFHLAREQLLSIDTARPSWALTGGSTPKAFYSWVVDKKVMSPVDARRILWTTSDERSVPLESDESNFGNAARMMLDPFGVAERQRFPWPGDGDCIEGAQKYAKKWSSKVSENWAYDVCFLGMGDDCHTLSLFPGSELLQNEPDALFAAVDVPGKGWRLTLTPKGLEQCGLIVLMTLGEGKAEALKSVLQGDYDPINKPSQILKRVSDRAVWLVDEAAASKLEL